MQKINSASDLDRAIRQLESDQNKQGELLKNQFALTLQSLTPRNLMMNVVEGIVRSSLINLIGLETLKIYGHRLIDRVFHKNRKAPETD